MTIKISIIHQGMTLIELMLACSIMAMAAVAIASLGTAAESAAAYENAHGEIAQQARMIAARISRAVETSVGNENFPGFIVISTMVDGELYPDALVVWNPDTDAANPDAMPLKKELVVFMPHPVHPNTLVELTMPHDSGAVPAIGDTSAWQNLLHSAQTGAAGVKTVLTRQLRVRTTDGGPLSQTYDPQQRGAVRFESRQSPSDDQLEAYKDGNLDWDQLTWPQNIYSSETGLRQSWVRFEIQLVPDNLPEAIAVPFFGSGAAYYDIERAKY